MKRSYTHPLSVAAVLTAATLVASAQQPAPPTPPPAQRTTFRLDINYVEVDAIVTDAKGQFVRGLTPGDFEVRENGVPQQVSVLALVDLPIALDVATPRGAASPAAPRVPAPDTASNAPAEDGRVYLLVLDTHHVDPNRTPLVRQKAREFIERYVQPGDRAAVVHIGYPALNQEFTTNKAWLLKSVSQFIGEKTTASAIAIANADPDSVDSGARPDREAGTRAMMSERTVFALGELTTYLAGSRGRRKALVFFSEGLDVDVTDVLNDAAPMSDLFSKLQDTYTAAARSHVAFYTIDPRGVADPMEDLIKVGGTKSVGPDRPTASPAQALLAQLRVEQNFMRNLAEVTGGLTSVGSGDFARAFSNIVADNSRYYLLGYHSTDTRLDGRLRKIDVKVTRPGLDVRARKGYYADTPATVRSAADPMLELLNGPVSISGLRMTAAAAAMPGEGGRARVHLVVEFGGDDLAFDLAEGKFTNDLDVAYRATSQDGQVRAHGREMLRLRLDDVVHQAITERGVRYAAEVELVAGRYQLRVAGFEHAGGHGGSVYLDLDVPDFDKGAVVLGDVMLTTPDAGRTPSARPADSLKDVLPGPPTAVREFADTDELSVFVPVRNNDARRSEVTVTTSVVSDDGREEFTASDRLDRGAVDAPPGVLIAIPLTGMPPGQYVIVIEATFDGETAPAATRRLPFRIK